MRKPFSMKTRHYLEGYAFTLPWLIGFLLFMAVPLGKSLYYAFQSLEVKTEGLKATYVGLENFRRAFTVDVDFTPKLIETVASLLIQVPLILIFAMFSALLLNRNFRGRMLFRGIFFLPVIIASGSVLTKLREDGAATLPIFAQYDLATRLTDIIPVQILLPLLKALDSLTVSMWDSGVQILIFLAGLQSISVQLYEAAKVDGATPWESFWKITFPMITPMILVNTLFSIVNSFTKPGNGVMEYMQTVVFQNLQFGYGSALGWIYFIIAFAVIGLVLTLFRNSLKGRG
ncbi:sugar ABC transporter permease [Paenibacillus sp. sptzw28]|uniref:carbohydrate ABC transporter permease n=1 Tax=Paenibacillus sp. sptzw28 TaxID=715179 RepID=UPI001C6E769D|nr:sugar ABC transporter permease [Paenibacillus sp. sptzw28]QYR21413.1 sugar ABC transporter permease [Paenibacillus sp. sptzw28]